MLKGSWLDLHMGPLTGLGNVDLQHKPNYQMGYLIAIAVTSLRRTGQPVYTQAVFLPAALLSSTNICLGAIAVR